MHAFSAAWAVLLLPLAGVALGYLAESRRGVAVAATGSSVLGLVASLVLLAAAVAGGAHAHTAILTFWTFPVVQTPFNAATSTLLAQNFQVGLGYSAAPSAAVLAVLVEVALVCSQLQLAIQLRRDPRLGALARLTSLLGFGVLLVVLAPELFQALVGFEICGLVAALLVGSAAGAGIGEAARRGYLVWRLGGMALLLGAGFIYVKFSGPIATAAAAVHHKGAVTPPDGLNLAALTKIWFASQHGLAAGVGGRTLALAAVLVLVAVAAGAGLFPLHGLWRSLGSGPGAVAGLLLGVAGGVVGAALLLDLYPLIRLASGALPTLTVLASLSSLVAAGLALRERRLRRLAIWLVASQAASVLAAFGLGSPAAGLVLLIPLALGAVGVLGVVSTLGREQRVETVVQLGAAWRRARPTTAALLSGLLALTGVVGLGTFFGRSALLGAALHGASAGLAAPPHLFRALGAGAVVISGVLLAWTCARTALQALRGEEPSDPREARLMRRHLAQGRGLAPLWPSLAAIALALVAGVLGLPGVRVLLGGLLAARPGSTAIPFEGIALLITLVAPLLAMGLAAALPLRRTQPGTDPGWVAWADGTALARALERLALGVPARGMALVGQRLLVPAASWLAASADELVRPPAPGTGRHWQWGWASALVALAGLGLAVAVVIWVAAGHGGSGIP
ncbi:MAG: hypothetical protein ACREOD_04195 [Candidatus Dormibacteria bacterium]